MLRLWSYPGRRPGMRDERGDSGFWAILQLNILPAAARPGSQGTCISRPPRQCVREGGSPSSTSCTCMWSEARQVQGRSHPAARQRQDWDLSPAPQPILPLLTFSLLSLCQGQLPLSPPCPSCYCGGSDIPFLPSLHTCPPLKVLHAPYPPHFLTLFCILCSIDHYLIQYRLPKCPFTCL